MKISRENYELWMIDYFDGKLSADEIAGLMSFIDLHADIKEEFELFDNEPLDAENITFKHKPSLRKQPILSVGEIHENNYESMFIAFYEGDLHASLKNDLLKFVSLNPSLKEEFALHGQLILEKDNRIIYENKEELKRKNRIGFYWWPASVAAALLLIFGLYSLIKIQPSEEFIRSEVVTILEKKTLDYSLAREANAPLVIPEIHIEQAVIVQTNDQPEAESIVKRYALLSELEKRDVKLILSDQSDIVFIEPSSSKDNFDEIYASAEPVEKSGKKGGLIGRILKNYAGKVSNEIPVTKTDDGKNEPGFVKILDQSIMVFNTITGSETEMVKTYDEDGRLTRYSVEGETISWGKDYASRRSGD